MLCLRCGKKDPFEAQARGGQSRPCCAAVSSREYRRNIPRLRAAFAHVGEGSGDDADHVPEEAVSGDFDADSVLGDGNHFAGKDCANS